MGEVWKARDARLDRMVVLKRLALPGRSGSAGATVTQTGPYDRHQRVVIERFIEVPVEPRVTRSLVVGGTRQTTHRHHGWVIASLDAVQLA